MDLFSSKYQKRISGEFSPSTAQIEGLKVWSGFLKKQDEKRRAERPTERDMHELFFRDVFVEVLGYEQASSSSDECTIASEYSTDVDATRPDGALGFFTADRIDGHVQVVIELKGLDIDLDARQNRSGDIRTPVDQAFSYAHKFEDVQWIIVSNFRELRLYHRSSSRYSIRFDLQALPDKPDQALFVKLLAADHLIARQVRSETSRIYEEREKELKDISDEFYQQYRELRKDTIDAISRQSNFDQSRAVTTAQKIIDRFLFIAFLEDSGLIPRETIASAYTTDNPYAPVSPWTNISGLFGFMDTGNEDMRIPPFNGGLFKTDADIEAIDLDDALVERYKQLADYDFGSDLRVNILGRVFEQSITELDGLRNAQPAQPNAKNRRHQEGAHYTPERITQFLAQSTLGRLFVDLHQELGWHDLPLLQPEDLDLGAFGSGKKKGQRKYPSKAAKARVEEHIRFFSDYLARLKGLRIVDPSVGSGAFLIAAFDELVEEGERTHRELSRLGAADLFERWDREVIGNNLYGVDINSEAVGITRLALWLRIAKNREPLMSLDKNICVGNAVIQNPDIDPDRAFDWHTTFPDVFKNGGFDVVLGNPPYVRHELIKRFKPGLTDFETYAGTADLYVYFFERGYNLLKDGGYLGFIASNKWMRAGYGEKLRRFFRKKVRMLDLIDMSQEDIFPDACVDPALVAFKKEVPGEPSYEIPISDPRLDQTDKRIASRHLNDRAWLLHDPLFFQIREKMERLGTPLAEWDIKINRGVVTGLNDAFIIDDARRNELIASDPRSAELIKKVLRGRDLQKWGVRCPGNWLIFARQGVAIEEYPGIQVHLEKYRDQLTPKFNSGSPVGRKPGKYAWYEIQDSVAYFDDFEKTKIIYPGISKAGAFSLDHSSYFHNDKIFHIVGHIDDLTFLVGILNSKLDTRNNPGFSCRNCLIWPLGAFCARIRMIRCLYWRFLPFSGALMPWHGDVRERLDDRSCRQDWRGSVWLLPVPILSCG